MGIQIQFAQSSMDEKEFVSKLLSAHRIRFLPRIFSSPGQSSNEFNGLDSEELVFFLSEYEDAVLERIKLVDGTSNRYQVFPKDNLCIEWTRSVMLENFACQYGRFFLSNNSHVNQVAERQTHQLMADVIAILKKYPMTSVAKPPVYVGAFLAESIRKGDVLGIAYRGGKIMEIVDNPVR